MNSTKTKPKRRVNDRARELITNLQGVREHLRELASFLPEERMDELRLMENFVIGHQDRLLDGETLLDDARALAELNLVNAFRRSIERQRIYRSA